MGISTKSRKPSPAYIRVTDKTNNSVQEYPTVALAAMDVRTTYPSLCYHLNKRNRIVVNSRFVVEKIIQTKRRNTPLAYQVRNMETGDMLYFHSGREASDYVGVSSQAFNRKAKEKSFFKVDHYRVYRIG